MRSEQAGTPSRRSRTKAERVRERQRAKEATPEPANRAENAAPVTLGAPEDELTPIGVSRDHAGHAKGLAPRA
jgi:hypothetical protein